MNSFSGEDTCEAMEDWMQLQNYQKEEMHSV